MAAYFEMLPAPMRSTVRHDFDTLVLEHCTAHWDLIKPRLDLTIILLTNGQTKKLPTWTLTSRTHGGTVSFSITCSVSPPASRHKSRNCVRPPTSLIDRRVKQKHSFGTMHMQTTHRHSCTTITVTDRAILQQSFQIPSTSYKVSTWKSLVYDQGHWSSCYPLVYLESGP